MSTCFVVVVVAVVVPEIFTVEKRHAFPFDFVLLIVACCHRRTPFFLFLVTGRWGRGKGAGLRGCSVGRVRT